MRVSIEKQTDAINRYENSHEENAQTKPVMLAELHVPEPEKQEKKREQQHKKWLDITKTVIEALTLIAVVYYACYARRQWLTMNQTYVGIQEQTTAVQQQTAAVASANDISRASNAIAQRAYLFFSIQKIQEEAASDASGREKLRMINPVIENGGNTPAFEVRQKTSDNFPNFTEFPKGFTFSDSVKHSKHSKSGPFPNMRSPSSSGIIGPHSFSGGAPVIVPEKVLEKVNTGESQVFLWGWVNYEDVFGCSHRTEYCWQIVYFRVDPDGTANFAFSGCSQHKGCADQNCKNWKPTNTPLCSLEVEPLK